MDCKHCGGEVNFENALDAFEFDDGFELECPHCGRDNFMKKDIGEKIYQAALEMFKANTAYGCGFYNDDDWLKAYGKLQKLVGYREMTAALGEYDKFEDLPDF